MAGTYKLIASNILGTNTASVTFSSIPGTYTDLVLRMSVRDNSALSNQASFINMQFNSDSTGPYPYTFLLTDGSTASSSTSLTNNRLKPLGETGGSFTSNTFGSTEVYISNYANSSYKKTVGVLGSAPSNAATVTYTVGAMSGRTTTNTAITSIYLYPDDGSAFAAGSSFYLYGVQAVTNPSAKATGGTISYGLDGYTYHAFTNSGTFTPTSNITADILIIAGGGAGGSTATSPNAGGGGAGGVVYASSQSLTSGVAKTVTVGAGGSAMAATGPTTSAANGSNSSFTGLTTAVGGGGGGGGSNGDLIVNGIAGGSGGGARGASATGGSPTSGQGNSGGNSATAYFGAGGGGAGAAGSNATSSASGAGGVGTTSYSTWGAVTNLGEGVNGSYYFAGGGSGAADPGGVVAGGYGGGGKSGGYTSPTTKQPGAGLANTGGGGGGAHNTNGNPTGYGGAGGKGVVIVRYLS